MIYEEPQLYMVIPNRSWPFIDDEYDPNTSHTVEDQYEGYWCYVRKVVLPSHTDSDPESGDPATDQYSYLSFIESGETAIIYGDRYLPGTVVLCQWINGQLFAIQDCFVAMPLQSRQDEELALSDGSTSFDDEVTLYTGTMPQINPYDHLPYTIELITTGEYKTELDGLYTLFSYFERVQGKRTRKNFGCMGTDLKGKPGATMLMEWSGVVYDGIVETEKTLTITHDDITTTVYSGYTDQLTKDSGDSTLPDDIYFRYVQTGNSPLWFELDTESTQPINGLYTLWCDYWEDTTNATYGESKGYMHKADGTRQTLTYSLGYNASTQVFTLSVTTSDDSFTYTCDKSDFSFVNGSRMTFTLGSDLSSDPGKLPGTLTVKRPKNGYNRAVKLEDQP